MFVFIVLAQLSSVPNETTHLDITMPTKFTYPFVRLSPLPREGKGLIFFIYKIGAKKKYVFEIFCRYFQP